MRAKRALAIVCVLMGGMAAASIAEASQTQANRSAQKQARAGQAAAQQAARAVRPARPAPRHIATRPAIPPQEHALAALNTPVRAVMGPGTPIRPVAMTGGLSCVPFARMATGMDVSGDARAWWHNAAGVYARGQVPERGSVLAFMSSGGMSRGHVAVVSRVVNARTIEIDHANWGGPGIRRGAVMRGVTVVDVSDRNDWTSVRVQVGWTDDTFGRAYPTHGFIYNRPAGTRVLVAEAGGQMQEVAEAPSPHVLQHFRLTSRLLGE
jgi:hypothetical protein